MPRRAAPLASVPVALFIACAGTTAGSRVERPPVAPVVEDAPAPPRLEDDVAPEGPACEASDACGEGQRCRGPAGCGSPWACGAPRECGSTTVSYCGCDGMTFYAPESCPDRPYRSVGPCEELGEEVALEDVEEVAGNTICASDADCRAGYACAGVAGCGTFWTCVRRRALRCSRERVPYCGCGGETFTASARCPGRPIAHAGYCAGDEPEEAIAVAPEGPPARGVPSTPQASTPPVTSTPPLTATPPVTSTPPLTSTPPVTATPPLTSTPPLTATPPQASTPARSGPRPCMSNRDCPSGLVCEGEEGCGSEWSCARPRERCVQDTQYFCGCDGQTFRASMTCPGRPHRRRGSCG